MSMARNTNTRDGGTKRSRYAKDEETTVVEIFWCPGCESRFRQVEMHLDWRVGETCRKRCYKCEGAKPHTKIEERLELR